jgi:hypothetical protein
MDVPRQAPGEILDDCGCCEGLQVDTPLEVYNRPGLSALAYRVGTHARFKGSMLAHLSDPRLRALRDLNTRDDDDFAVALLDAWASVADVLTFYSERIANESYLRTATERVSLLHLARLIGYELAPGVAASTYLSFELEDTPEVPSVPRVVTLEEGTSVQSLPGQDELPQTFETVEKIEARTEWNALRPRQTEPVNPGYRHTFTYLEGVTRTSPRGIPSSSSARSAGRRGATSAGRSGASPRCVPTRRPAVPGCGGASLWDMCFRGSTRLATNRRCTPCVPAPRSSGTTPPSGEACP